jgi:hypothetical protein
LVLAICAFFANYVWVKMESAVDWESWKQLVTLFVHGSARER